MFAAGPPRAYRDQVRFSLLEPVCTGAMKSCKTENPYLATYSAAWFKIYSNDDKMSYCNLIYGSGDGEGSICKYAPMAERAVQNREV